jgi:hypothetical protein
MSRWAPLLAATALLASGCARSYLVPRSALEEVSTLRAEELSRTAVPAIRLPDRDKEVWVRADTLGEVRDNHPPWTHATVHGGVDRQRLQMGIWLAAIAVAAAASAVASLSWWASPRPPDGGSGCTGCIAFAVGLSSIPTFGVAAGFAGVMLAEGLGMRGAELEPELKGVRYLGTR